MRKYFQIPQRRFRVDTSSVENNSVKYFPFIFARMLKERFPEGRRGPSCYRARRRSLTRWCKAQGAKLRTAEINLHAVARDSAASEPIRAGTVIKLRFSVTGAPAVTKLQVMPRVTQPRRGALVSTHTFKPRARSELSNSLELVPTHCPLFNL